MTESAAAEAVEVVALPSKEEQHDHYEIMVLVSGAVSDEQAKAAWDAVKQQITALRGELTNEEELGRRALAYTVAGVRQGSYFVAEFDMPKASLPQLNAKLRVDANVTRFLVIKKRKKTAEEIEQERKQREQRMIAMQMRKQAEMEASSRERGERKVTAPAAATPTVAPATAETKPAATPVATETTPEASTPAAEPAAAAAPAAATPEAGAADKKDKSLGDIDAEIEKLLSDDVEV